MSHHADSAFVASWSRSLTLCPSRVEDCLTNWLVEIRPTNKPSLTTFMTFGPLESVVLVTDNRRQQWKRWQGHTVSASNTVEGLQSLECVSFSFFLCQSLWASNPNPNDHMTGTLAQESTYSHPPFRWWSSNSKKMFKLPTSDLPQPTLRFKIVSHEQCRIQYLDTWWGIFLFVSLLSGQPMSNR